jgi:2-iminobutanoate/2-iminopropanoate deaminase
MFQEKFCKVGGMRFRVVMVCGLLLSGLGWGQEIKPLIPATGPRPVGPYTPGLSYGDFTFVSGQGVGDGSGRRPSDMRGQVIQCLNNIRNILRVSGLDLANIFSLQIYYTDKAQEAVIEQVLKDTFSGRIPLRSILYVPKLPVETPIEITAFAHKTKQTGGLVSPALDRPAGCVVLEQFVQCGVEMAAGGNDLPQQTAAVLGALEGRLRAVGSSLAKVVSTNVYLADMAEFQVMNATYASFFPQTKPTRSTVQPFALPKGRVAISVVATR